MKKITILWTLLLSLFAANSGFGQQPARKTESGKFRAILTIGGAGGGFALGVVGGLAAFDDAVNSDRKVWTTAILAGIAGGVGGYFLGRSLDKRSANTSWRHVPDPLDRSLMDILQAGQPAGQGACRVTRHDQAGSCVYDLGFFHGTGMSGTNVYVWTSPILLGAGA